MPCFPPRHIRGIVFLLPSFLTVNSLRSTVPPESYALFLGPALHLPCLTSPPMSLRTTPSRIDEGYSGVFLAFHGLNFPRCIWNAFPLIYAAAFVASGSERFILVNSFHEVLCGGAEEIYLLCTAVNQNTLLSLSFWSHLLERHCYQRNCYVGRKKRKKTDQEKTQESFFTLTGSKNFPSLTCC